MIVFTAYRKFHLTPVHRRLGVHRTCNLPLGGIIQPHTGEYLDKARYPEYIHRFNEGKHGEQRSASSEQRRHRLGKETEKREDEKVREQMTAGEISGYGGRKHPA